MNLSYALILGIVQGLTEFLPVSSSGHLVLVQSALPGFTQPGVLLDVVLHLGTTAAVLVYFRYEIIRLSLQEIKYLVVGSIPAAIVGLLFESLIEDLFLSTVVVGVALLITSGMNYLTDRAAAKRERMSLTDALVIGIGQAVAIIPGISRSGTTIFAGTSMGVDRRKTAEFSFLLSIPAIMGAGILQLVTHSEINSLPIAMYITGFVVSFIVGIGAIMLVFRLLVEKKFTYFAIYCLIVGIIALLL